MSVTGPAGSFRRSNGIAVVPFGDGAYVFDVATGVFHRVGPAAATLLADDTETSVDDAVDMFVAASGVRRRETEPPLRPGRTLCTFRWGLQGSDQPIDERIGVALGGKGTIVGISKHVGNPTDGCRDNRGAGQQRLDE